MKLSIITVNLNDASGLRKTIESVLSQTYTDYEYIIIDGGSIDASVDVIKEYAGKITFWVSEPDSGIYNAINKGIIHANGIYCLILNSGDYLLKPDVLEKCLPDTVDNDIVYGNIIFEKAGVGKINKPPSVLTFRYFYLGTLCHQSAFIKRDLFKKIGLYNENYKIVSDWEFFLKAIFIQKCSTLYLDQTIVNYDGEGLSSNSYEDSKERMSVLKELFPRFIPDYKKLTQISEYTHIHSSNKYIRKLADFINKLLFLRRKSKARRD